MNALVFTSAILLFYFFLRALQPQRLFALLPPLVYALLPHYSTQRFWFASFQGNLSMALYFLSSLACLRWVRVGGSRAWEWTAVLSLLASILAYEMAAPLFALTAFATWQVSRSSDKPPARLSLASFMLTYLGSLLAVGFLKALTTVRGPAAGFEQQIFAFDVAKTVREGLEIPFVSYGIALPKRAEQILRAQPDATILVWSALVGGATSVYLYRASRDCVSSLSATSAWLKTIVVGLVAFVLGFSVFAAFGDIPFATTGLNNRIAVAASVGTAFVFVGVIGLVASWFPRPWMQRVILCSFISLVCASGFAVINGEASGL